MEIFTDRRDAGRKLAQHLLEYTNRSDVIVLALPRGGVPVGFEIAHELNVPLDVLIVRKLGVPGQEELAAGAIGPDGVIILNDSIARRLTREQLDILAERERREVSRRENEYRGKERPPLSERVRGQTVILVDDGLATGASMRAAITAVRHFDPTLVVVAIPVAPHSGLTDLRYQADDVVFVECPDPFWSVGAFYEDFSQTTDDEVVELLEKIRLEREEPESSRTVSRQAARDSRASELGP